MLSQNNQTAGKDKINPAQSSAALRPSGAPEKTGVESFNIKIPPQGALDPSKTVLNSNGVLKPDKNIKVDLDLNSAPRSIFSSSKNSLDAGHESKPVSQPAQNNSLPASAQKNDLKNNEKYKLSNTEVQGPKPPLVAAKNHALIFILISALAIGALAIGGYYLMKSGNDNLPAAIISPSPLPTINLNPDTDSDNIPDAVEKAIGTNPDKMDTDSDGYNDLPEIKNGYSPLIAGGIGKYTPEQLQALKDKIKAADAGFFDKEFGAPAVLQSPSLSPNVSLSPSSVISPAIK